jgi:hypothetical protein
MVLVQEDDLLSEYVIYYLIQGLVGLELNYSHIEKISLAAVHAIQRFRHYILFRKTSIIVVVNPFQYVLTRRVIGGKISRWIVVVGIGKYLGFNSQEHTNKTLTTVPFGNTCEADEVSPEVEAGVVARFGWLQDSGVCNLSWDTNL